MYKHLALVLALTAAVTLAVSTTGFSSAAADRQVSAEVVEDENAYLLLQYEDHEPTDPDPGDSVRFVTVTNHFSQSVDFTVRYAVKPGGSDDPTEYTDQYHDVGVGNSIGVNATVTCQSDGTANDVVSFDVTADGESVYATTTSPRTVEYDVECPDTSTSTDG